MFKRSFVCGFILLLSTVLALPLASASQYPPQTTLQDLIDAERASRTTLAVELTINNLAQNVLNIGKSPTGNTDRRGFNIVAIDDDQVQLPIVGSFPVGLFDRITVSLEGTDFAWDVLVDANGVFLTDFPLSAFPAGQYYLTLEGIRVLRVIVPEAVTTA
ncbi:MAG: hypothetical protein SGI73_14925 [Chloroflexota bacterium]|nr:hypothetical protein [Chloroflexota bacterium]